MSEPRVIKKYPNRRLYDTAISQYVTLDDIRQLVTEAQNFKVIDAKTNEDLTRAILLQIIVEQEDNGEPILSADFLARIIRFYGDTMQGFMGSYLEKSIDSFLQQQEAIRSQLNSLMENTPMSVMSDMAERNMDMWKTMQDNFLSAYTNPGSKKNSSKSD
ncbi:MAG: polyhydroxyalkanoate synthesis repressor PhaR [Gammaproteobacteria bacterium]